MRLPAVLNGRDKHIQKTIRSVDSILLRSSSSCFEQLRLVAAMAARNKDAHAVVVMVSCLWAACWASGQAQVDVQDEQLHGGDFEALKAIRGSLADLPGSFFFDTWEMENDEVAARGVDPAAIYPCTSFAGLLCDYVEGVLRVRELNLGTSLADSPGLTGSLHPAMGSLTALQQLTLVPGQVSGELPPSLGTLQELQYLAISNNRIWGSIPTSLTQLRALRTLDLSANNLQGSVPPSLLQLPSLRTLLLSYNRLVGRLPRAISSPLAHLNLQNNFLSGPLPRALPPNLSFLSLAHNKLSGNLTALSHSSPTLYFVDLSFNKLAGTLPSSLLSGSLHSLLLQHNHLRGPLDPQSLAVIDTLDLSFNEFSCSLSPLLSTASNLYLNNNRFRGRVPQEFADQLLAGGIHDLYLQYNRFSRFQLDPLIPLPLTASLCITMNCMETPIQSHCPDDVAVENNEVNDGCE